MDRPHMRPRIEIVVPSDLAAVRDEFQRRVEHPTCTCRGRLARNHLHVEVGPERRHFWSPTLDVTLRTTDQGTLILGRFGPHPDVWTLYMFVYATWAFIAVVGLSWGMGQAAMGESPACMLAVPGAAILAGLTWLTARVGATIGHHQMEDLFRMVDGLGQPRRDEAQVAPREPST